MKWLTNKIHDFNMKWNSNPLFPFNSYIFERTIPKTIRQIFDSLFKQTIVENETTNLMIFFHRMTSFLTRSRLPEMFNESENALVTFGQLGSPGVHIIWPKQQWNTHTSLDVCGYQYRVVECPTGTYPNYFVFVSAQNNVTYRQWFTWSLDGLWVPILPFFLSFVRNMD